MFRLTQLLLGVLILVFLYMLRPPALGGTASYITVSQAGLEPLVYQNDLAIVRQATEYEPGELVAVQTQAGPYFGRVVGQEGGIFQVWFLGEANPVDVAPEYLLGRIWFNIGNIGRRISGSIFESFSIQPQTAP